MALRHRAQPDRSLSDPPALGNAFARHATCTAAWARRRVACCAPLVCSARSLAPVKQYSRKALQEANVAQRRLVSGFLSSSGLRDNEQFKALTGIFGAGSAAPTDGGAGGTGSGGSAGAPRTATTESALLRAEMLALGLSRSATSAISTRRLRLLQELEASVRELEAEGFDDRQALGALKEQIRTSYAPCAH